MRHRQKKIKLSRSYDHRRALQRNLARAFFLRGKIVSSRPKIKASQRFVERLISRGRKGDLNARRYLFRFWQDQHFVNYLIEIFRQLKGESGFTRYRPFKLRRGDSTRLYLLEFSQKVKIPLQSKEKPVAKAETKQKTVTKQRLNKKAKEVKKVEKRKEKVKNAKSKAA